MEMCDALLEKTAELAKEHNSGVTILFVHEPAWFDLPIFRTDDRFDHEKVRKALQQKAQSVGIEEPAILVFEGDTPDRVALEVEKEGDTLVICNYHKKISAKISARAKAPLLVLKKAALHLYTKAVVAIDAVMPERCLNFMNNFFAGVELRLYQDFQFIPMPTIDPAVEPLDISMDASVYTELLEAKREAFMQFCKEKGLKGKFEIGEAGIDEDTVAYAKEEDADLLVLAPLDPDTILGDAVEDILQKSHIDTLICYEVREL
jgi:nucleotide-binding universal stress UspA family protein